MKITISFEFYRRIVLFVVAFLFFVAGNLPAPAQNPILVEQNEYFGYRNQKGVIVIPVQYLLAGKFSKEGIASVLDKQGWAVHRPHGTNSYTTFYFRQRS